MSQSNARLHVKRARARSLLGPQVEGGQALQNAIARATEATELSANRSWLAAWSEKNERLLSRIFGAAERRAYIAACKIPSGTGSIPSPRSDLEGHVAAGLEYLHDALARIDLADEPLPRPQKVTEPATHPREQPTPATAPTQQGGGDVDPAGEADGQQATSSAQSRWRAIFRNGWVISVGSILIASALAGLASKIYSAVMHHTSTITGTVTCESGRPVVDVWIAAASGQSGSGYAHLGPPNSTGISSPPGPTASYSYRLADGGSYAVHVGCGGTAQNWASKNYSPLLSQPNVRLHCYDPVRAAAPGTTPTGTCKEAPGS